MLCLTAGCTLQPAVVGNDKLSIIFILMDDLEYDNLSFFDIMMKSI